MARIDLEQRGLAAVPVGSEVGGGDGAPLHGQRVRIPAFEPRARIVAGSEEGETERGQALLFGPGKVACDERRLGDLGRDCRGRCGREDHAPDEIGMLDREHPRDHVAERMAEDHRGWVGKLDDDARDVAGEVLEVDASHRPGRARNPTGLRAQHAPALSHDPIGETVEIVEPVAPVAQPADQTKGEKPIDAGDDLGSTHLDGFEMTRILGHADSPGLIRSAGTRSAVPWPCGRRRRVARRFRRR